MEYIETKDWLCTSAPGRWDAFNFDQTKKSIESMSVKTTKLAIDMSGIQFVNLPAIKFIHAIALDMRRKGGQLVLIGATEKLKKQIRIFASLDPLQFYSRDHWNKYINTDIEGNA